MGISTVFFTADFSGCASAFSEVTDPIVSRIAGLTAEISRNEILALHAYLAQLFVTSAYR
jgi:hypothetical protein